ncbi:PAS domain-containing protein [Mucilaginibacter robiniae]|uniref:histidine kinase n=2 Tax=Mucilaginibacter robiniae TaxID=2728022 RepID=A0A7L5E4Z0_9SPHI|nr:PAS domain-containing protein [Mucilaginibacter robiniae]
MQSDNHVTQQSFQQLVEASPMPTAIYWGQEMQIIAANQAMLQTWGKDSSVLNKPLKDALPELEGQPFFDLLNTVFTTGQAYEAQEDPADLIVDGKLQTFYFTFTYKALKGTDGQTQAIINTATDVTELVLARQQVAETQERLVFALDAAEVGTWDLDPINNVVNWDARCRELFGFDGNSIIPYHDVLSCIHPDDAELVRKAVTAAINPYNSSSYDIRYRTVGRHNQQVRWVHCKGKAYFNNDNAAYRFAGTAQDITTEVNARQRELQLLSLVNNNADQMTVADMDGHLLYMNQAAKKMLGVDAGTDVHTLSANDFYMPDELKRVQQQVIKEISEHEGWQGIINLMNRKTREVIPCQVSFILIKDLQTGNVIGRGATIRDLRPEIKAKTELQRLATIVDSSEDFCNYCDISGNTIYLNKAGSELIGLNKETLSGTTIFDYHSVAANDKIKDEVLPQLLKTGRWSGQLELLHQKTSEIIPIHKQFFVVREDITNEPIAIAGIARDLRPELNARKAIDIKNTELNKAVKELEFLADSVPAVVWSSTPDGLMDYINQRWSEHSIQPVEAALGTGWLKDVHPEDVQPATALWNASIATGEPYQVEIRRLDKYGHYRWWLVRAVPLRDENGQVIKWYGSNTDITEQKELSQQKDNFLGVASHELKTPVTSLKAYTQVMESMFRRSGDIKNAEMLAKMDKQINRLNSLIGDLLDVTKINTGRLQFNDTVFDFSQMVEEVVEDLQRTASKHQMVMELNFHGTVIGDRDRVGQVIINLLTNAIKYSPEANRIVVQTSLQGAEVQLCVQDFGIGISADKKDRVFEQFYRVSGTREHTFPGLGLGLYISAEIIKHMGGRMWVDSVEGEGSTFCFAVPVHQS